MFYIVTINSIITICVYLCCMFFFRHAIIWNKTFAAPIHNINPVLLFHPREIVLWGVTAISVSFTPSGSALFTSQIDSWLAHHRAIDLVHVGRTTSVDPWLIKMNHIQQSVERVSFSTRAGWEFLCKEVYVTHSCCPVYKYTKVLHMQSIS